jgi:hypothetical protein
MSNVLFLHDNDVVSVPSQYRRLEELHFIVECSQFRQTFKRTTSLRKCEAQSNTRKGAEMTKVQVNALSEMLQNLECEHDLRRWGNRIDANQKTQKRRERHPS